MSEPARNPRPPAARTPAAKPLLAALATPALAVPSALTALAAPALAALRTLVMTALASLVMTALASLVMTALAALLVPATPALAQGPELSAHNPRPDPLDIDLPMPCGLTMTFRVAAVPVEGGLLTDLGLSLGGGGDYGESLLSRPHQAFVASSLTVDELPEAKRAAASRAVGGRAGAQIYLIGKYEVASAQWAAVMEGCQALPAQGALPKGSVSWFEAVRFTETWMRWLLANAPEALPRFANDPKNVGLIRLPTEGEWEYAARGGQAASPEALASETPVLAEGRTIEDHAVIGEAPAAIGGRAPNPLGLYDTAGNLAEMTMDTFRMTVDNRLHGAHGGVTVKGGSHRDRPADTRPGRRQEMPLFDRSGAARAPDVGLRVVVSAINVPGGRLPKLRAEFEGMVSGLVESMSEPDWWDQAKADQAPPPEAPPGEALPERPVESGPVGRIRGLIETVSEPTHQAALRELLADMEIAVKDRHERTYAEIQDKCAALLYAAWGIRDTSLRRALVERRLRHFEKTVEEIPRQLRMNIDAEEKAELQRALQEARDGQAPLLAELPQYDRSLGQQFNYYKSLLFEVNDYDRELVLAALDAAARSLQGEDPLSASMRRSLNIVAQDVKSVLAGRNDLLDLGRLMVKLQQPAGS